LAELLRKYDLWGRDSQLSCKGNGGGMPGLYGLREAGLKSRGEGPINTGPRETGEGGKMERGRSPFFNARRGEKP